MSWHIFAHIQDMSDLAFGGILDSHYLFSESHEVTDMCRYRSSDIILLLNKGHAHEPLLTCFHYYRMLSLLPYLYKSTGRAVIVTTASM